MSETLTRLRDAIDRARTAASAEREEADAAVCLASRSAYFDFYTWVVLNGSVDPPAAAELDELFRHSLTVMESGRFKESVKERYGEFRDKCDQVRRGAQSSMFDPSTIA